MKHRALSILLALVFLLSVCMFCTTAFAASGNQDGVTAELTTDKTDYVAGESISVSLVVKNANARVTNVRTELVLPAGVSLTTGTLVSTSIDLAPNTEANYNYGLTVDEPAPTTTTPPATTPSTTTPPTTNAPTTPGEDNDDVAPETRGIVMAVYGVVAVASLVGLIALVGVKNIFKQRWFVLVLCGALLLGVVGPIAAFAAATEQTFTVPKKITLNGASAEIKAIITYDMNDEAAYTEEVAFKKDGQFLWSKVVEMGYYLPSDVTYNGQTTSRNDAYRPEVTPPYIDMLFGCTSNQTGAFVRGEFTVDIFPESAEQTALIGLTDDPASKAALELIDEDEWIITVIDGKLVVTGWYDNATVAAARALYALATADAADITLKLPMIGKLDYVDVDLPAVTFGNFLGGMDSDFGAVVLRWNEVVADDFDAYCAALEAAGYELYESNTMDGFKQTKTLEFATYVKGDDAVLVQYLPVSLLDQDPDTLTAAELKAYNATFRPDGDSIRLILTSADLLGNNDAANTGWTDLGITPKMHMVNLFDTIGQAQVFTLADGSFIVVDGGNGPDMEQLYYTLASMNERPDGKIVVAAWFLTHDHIDHVGALLALSESEYAKEITIEQVVLNHHASSYVWRQLKAPYEYSGEYAGVYDEIEEVIGRFAQGDNVKWVMPHLGQILKIRNAEVEMMNVGDEDLYPVHMGNSNAMSLYFRVTFPEVSDQEIMIMGDASKDQDFNFYFPLMCGELHADILQVSHHGQGGQSSVFYPMLSDVEVCVWPTTWWNIDRYDLMFGKQNGGLREFEPLDIVCEEYVQTIEIPFNKDTDQVVLTRLSTFKNRLQNAEMSIATLGVGRFGGDVVKYIDATAEMLLDVNADVLVLNSVSYTQADGTNVVETVADALNYPYWYYAPAWNQEAGSDMTVSNNGTYGNLIFSRFPIVSYENLIYHEGTTADASNEGRAAGHIVVRVENKKNVDIYFTEVQNASSWSELAQVIEPESDVWFIVGVTKNGLSAVQTALGDDTVVRAVADHDRENIYASGTVTLTDGAKTSVNATTGCANMDALVTVNAKFAWAEKTEQPTNPETEDTHVMGWWVNGWRNVDDAITIAEEIVAQNPDIAVILSAGNHGYSALTSEQFAEMVNYPYHYIVQTYQYPTGETRDNIIFSKSELTFDESYTAGGDTFSHLTTTVDGRGLDLFVGHSAGYDTMESSIKSVVDASGNDFVIVAEYFAGVGETYAGKNVVKQAVVEDANVAVVASTENQSLISSEIVSKPASLSWIGYCNEIHMVLSNEPPAAEDDENAHIMGWWVNGWRNVDDAITIAEEIIAQDPDIAVILSAGNHGYSALTSEQFAEMVDYPYCYIETIYQYPTGETQDNLIFSKTELEFVEKKEIAENIVSYLTTVIDGREIDLFACKGIPYGDLESYVKSTTEASGNDFVIVAEYFAGVGETYAGKNVVKKEIVEDANVAVVASTENQSLISSETVSKPASLSWIGYCNEIHMVLGDKAPATDDDVDDDATRVMTWFINGYRNASDANVIANEIKAQDPDIVVLIGAGNHGYSALTSEQFAQMVGYPYYYIAKNYQYPTGETRDELIFSKTELVFVEQKDFAGDVVSYLTTVINGREIDLFTGMYIDRSGMEEYIAATVAASGNEFLLFTGNNPAIGDTFAGKPVEVQKSGATTLVASTNNLVVKEKSAADNPADLSGWVGYEKPAYMTLEVKPAEVEPSKIMTWFINGYRNANDANVIANEIKAQDPDIVVLIGAGNHGYSALTSEQFAAMVGYPYYYIAQNYQYPTGETRDELIFSKTELVFVEQKDFAGDVVSYLTTVINGREIDLFTGMYIDRSGMEEYIAATVAASGNEFLLFTGNNPAIGDTFAGKPVEVQKSGATTLVASTNNLVVKEKSAANNPADLSGWVGYEKPAYMTLEVKP